MAYATENWSEWEWVQGAGGRRGFTITDAVDAVDAMASLASQFGITFAASHDLDPSIGAERPIMGTPRGPRVYDAIVNYVPKSQLGPGGGGELDTRIRWRWRSAPREESTDVDAQDRPILNAAGQPFQSDFTRPFNGRILIARRLEVNYRSGVAEQFENAANLNQVTIARVGTFAKGRLKLLSYEPEDEYTSDGTEPLWCSYAFEVRAGAITDSDDIWDGFKFRIRNEGFMGWYQPPVGDAVLGDFVTADGEPVSEPVLLDKDGKPLDPNIRVKGTAGTTNDPIAWPEGPLDQNVIEETESGVVFLKYRRCPVLNFAPLGLF